MIFFEWIEVDQWIASIKLLEAEVDAWVAQRNSRRVSVDWQCSVSAALARHYKSASNLL